MPSLSLSATRILAAALLVAIGASAQAPQLPKESIAPQPISSGELSRRTTALAAELFETEKKTAAKLHAAALERAPGRDAGIALERLLYDDVLNLIDAALVADAKNVHAHALAADVLMLKSYDGDGTYDVCTLLDAQDQADFVVANASRAARADLLSSRALLKRIEAIPRNRINGDEGDCADDSDSADSDGPAPNGT